MIKPSPFDLFALEYHVVRLRNRWSFRLGAKGDRDARKIFVIGHPRTATAAIHRILVDNGIRAKHTARRWRTAAFDAFSDRGHYQPVDLLDRHYRRSVFVLNTRPAGHYLRSRMKQTAKSRRNSTLPHARFARAHIRNELLRRNAYLFWCARHFRDRDNLIVLNIERPGAFDFMRDQLGLARAQASAPNQPTQTPDDEMSQGIHAAFAELGVEDQLAHSFVIPELLDSDERGELDMFFAHNRDRIYL